MSKLEQGHESAISRGQELLLDFLRDHDATCPVCGYNVRALTRPVCPECRHELTLAVGAARLRIGWLLAAIAPGFFSGIAAFFLSIPIIVSHVLNDPAPTMMIVLDVFGWCSGVFAIVLVMRRIRFIAMPIGKQRLWALAIWFVHIAALGAFILIVFRFV